MPTNRTYDFHLAGCLLSPEFWSSLYGYFLKGCILKLVIQSLILINMQAVMGYIILLLSAFYCRSGRFAIKSDFKSVPLGQFSWFSFIFISILFGIEHQRWLVGIFAGMIYSGVLYRSKNLFDPILSHGITNSLLGMYVLSTHQWSFW